MKFYSEIKYFENSVLGGGIHVCTTEFKVLFNLNDLFELLALSKPLRKRWKEQVGYDTISFKRNGRSVYEPFVYTDDANFILSLYGKNIKDQMMRKLEVEYQLTNIIKEYGDENKLSEYGFGDGDDLSYEFAIQNLKEYSQMHDNVLDHMIAVIEKYPYKKYNRLNSTMQFDLESERKKKRKLKHMTNWLKKLKEN